MDVSSNFSMQGDRKYSSSVADRPRAGSQSAAGTRRMSRVTEIRPSFRPNRPLMEWLYANFDKATIGLAINFLILIVLLMMLKNFMTFVLPNSGQDKANNLSELSVDGY